MNETEFLKAYDQYADVIFWYCYFRISDREKAKDLLQETFMRAWRYVTEGKKIDNIKAFLYRVANNVIIDEYRKRKPISSLEDIQEDGFEVMGEKDVALTPVLEKENIDQILHKIDGDQKEVLVMRYVDDLSIKEIANILQVSENVVSVRIYRALEKIRDLGFKV